MNRVINVMIVISLVVKVNTTIPYNNQIFQHVSYRYGRKGVNNHQYSSQIE